MLEECPGVAVGLRLGLDLPGADTRRDPIRQPPSPGGRGAEGAPCREGQTAFPLPPGEGQGLSTEALAKVDEGPTLRFMAREQF